MLLDIESSPHIPQDDSHADSKPILEPQLNVGGHGATQRRLKNYQVTMIGFCSGIGTGLFIGTGSAYAKAGPAGLLLAYLVVGSVLWCVMQSIAELATVVCMYPSHLRFKPHVTRFPPRARSRISRAGSSTRRWASRWRLAMGIVIRFLLRPSVRRRRFLWGIGRICRRRLSLPSVLCSFWRSI